MFLGSAIGAAITIPLWLTSRINDRAMLGITLALSWAALLYESYNAIHITKEE